MPRARQIVGLDIGNRTVRAVWAEASAGFPRIARVETFGLPADAQDAPKLVRAWIEKAGLARAFCAVSLPGGQAVFQPGRLPQDHRTTPQEDRRRLHHRS